MAAPRIGSTVKVTVYANQADYGQLKDGQEVTASIVSQGPPGVSAYWGRTTETPGRWLLVRKSKHDESKHVAMLNDPGIS